MIKDTKVTTLNATEKDNGEAKTPSNEPTNNNTNSTLTD